MVSVIVTLFYLPLFAFSANLEDFSYFITKAALCSATSKTIKGKGSKKKKEM